jgi:hypothetical protein
MVDTSLGFLERGGEMGERMRVFDWGRTPLGDPSGWPQSLKTIVRVMLDSRFAMWMAWGSEATFFCNDAYLPTVGIKRDWVLGARADVAWAEIWHDIGPRIGQVLSTGTATWDEGLQLFLERSGYLEETFHTFSYSPVYDDADSVAGMLCVVVEDTERAIGERRLRLLRELAALPIRELPSLAAAAAQLVSTLGNSPQDLPFAALYLPDRLPDRLPDGPDAPDGRDAALARITQTANVPPDALPRRLARDAASPGPLAQEVREAERSGLPQLADGIAAHIGEIRGPSRCSRRSCCRWWWPGRPRTSARWWWASARAGGSTTTTAASCRWWPRRSRRGSARCVHGWKSARRPRRWPSSTARRTCSSAT